MTGPSIKAMVDSIMPQVLANHIVYGEPRPIDCQPLLDLIRKTVPSQLAKDLVSVQPMDPTLGKQLADAIANSPSEEQLIAEGYKPVCPITRLMWIKDEEKKPEAPDLEEQIEPESHAGFGWVVQGENVS